MMEKGKQPILSEDGEDISPGRWTLCKIDKVINSLTRDHFKKTLEQKTTVIKGSHHYQRIVTQLKDSFWRVLNSPTRYIKHEKTLITAFDKLFEEKNNSVDPAKIEREYDGEASEAYGKIYEAFLDTAEITCCDAEVIFGALSPRDYFTLLFYVTVSGGVERDYLDGVPSIFLGGKTSTGKTTISSPCFKSAVTVPITDRGVSRFDCAVGSTLFLFPDIPIGSLFRSDNFDYLKNLTRAEYFSIKIKADKKSIPPHFCLVVSNDALFVVNGTSSYVLQCHKHLRKIDPTKLEVMRRRFVQVFCQRTPADVSESLFRHQFTFINTHAYLYFAVLNIMKERANDVPAKLAYYVHKALDFNSIYVPLSLLRKYTNDKV